MGITAGVSHRSAIAWAPHATERWMPAPGVAPRLEALPATRIPMAALPTLPDRQPSRLVAIAHVLATWRAAERTLASLPDTDPGRWRAQEAVAAARADYHRMFAEHRARLEGAGGP